MHPAELRARREQLGLTQAQLGARLGVAANTIARWERGAAQVGSPALVELSLERLGQPGSTTPTHVLGEGTRRRRSVPRVPPYELSTPQSWRLHGDPAALVARDRERVELSSLLLTPAVRLVTITGMPGCGKTRLAIDAALALEARFEASVVFVELAPLRDPELVGPTLARQLGVRDLGIRPVEDCLEQYLGDRRLFLILDNCEHVLHGLNWLTRVLTACPMLTVLATSRVLLHLSYEHEFKLAPLRLPNADELRSVDDLRAVPAVALFVQEARAAKPEFALTGENSNSVAAVCATLDGLPLALQLAAARVRVLTPGEILARLDRRFDVLVGGRRDEPPRHQSLREAIAWSYDLLTTSEQTLLRTLAVFVGGFSLDAVEAISSAQTPSGDPTLNTLTALVESSLVIAEMHGEGTRYRLAETIREYALELLVARGELHDRQRSHAGYFSCLAQTAGPCLFAGPDELRSLALLDADCENLRAALDWSVQANELEILTSMSAALWDYWAMRGYLGDGHRWLQLAVSTAAGPGVERARVLHGLAIFAGLRADFAHGAEYFVASVALLRHANAPGTLSRALADWGFCAAVTGDASGQGVVEEALATARRAGDDRAAAYALYAHGFVAYLHADYERAATTLRESVALHKANDSLRGAGYALVQLAASTRALGDPHGAATMCAAALGMFHQLGEKWGSYLALIQAALAAAGCGEASRAACLLGAADALRVAVGASATTGGVHPDYEFGMAAARDSLGDESTLETWTKGHAMPLVRAMDLAMRPDQSALSVRAVSKVEDQLTPREREVAVMVALGQSNREIAAELVVALRTAETHIERIFVKLGVRSRVQLARWVLSQNLLTTTPRQ